MAQILVFVDDVSGEEGADTLTFAVQGVEFEIDLAVNNRDKFYTALAPWIEHARCIGKGTLPEELRGVAKPQRRSRKHSHQEVAACREWINLHGLPQPNAIIPKDIWAAYAADDTSLLRDGRLNGSLSSR